MFETKKLLENKGHQVMIFSMKNSVNEKSNYSKYFIENFDINEAKSFWDKIKLIPKVIFNFESEKKIRELVQKERPEVAHIHDVYHYVTPSVLFGLKKEKIPMAHKLSAYELICPNYKLFTQGDICNRCKGGKYYNCLKYKCLKNSWGSSFVGMLEAYIHRFLKSYEKIDFLLAPSEFMRNKFIEFGYDKSKIKVLRNVLNLKDYQPEFNKEKFFLYSGRLAEEKGLMNLIEAFRVLKKEDKLKNHILYLMGEGPQETELKEKVRDLDLTKEIIFIGFKKKWSKEWVKYNSRAKLNILPSLWFDNSPIAISEAMAFGTVPLVSNRGGTSEMVKDEKSGLVFLADSIEDLAEKISLVIDKKIDLKKMQKKAVKRVREINGEEIYYEKLMSIYKELIEKNENRN
jgi:glycosyltransferase involved in cell wall biosynthesis